MIAFPLLSIPSALSPLTWPSPLRTCRQARFSAQGEALEVRFDSPTDTPGDPPPAAASGAPAVSVCAAALADLAPLGANATCASFPATTLSTRRSLRPPCDTNSRSR